MKYVRFMTNDEVMFGILEGEVITKLDGNYIGRTAVKVDETYNLSDVKLLAPVVPGQLVAIGLNYKGHAEEVNKPVPEEPMMFMVSPTAVVGEGEPIEIVNAENRTDYEAEIAIVIGKKASQVAKEDALSYVFGYTGCNDVSDRVLQKKDGQFTRAKSFATYKPVGPVIATDINPNNVKITLTVNGEVKQDSNTNDLIHNIETVIERVTEVMTLNPGDMIITGTPEGVGPLKSGDEVKLEIEGIGTLTNPVIG
ncbi:MAG: fumarylacetoacetate hydrolase family protein [Bacillaceae bacterium]|nr:fumarylacetoacetate hydrolase family protein [Bacillaceae bacterium]